MLAGRRWYSAALVLALSAIAAQSLANYHASRGMIAMARAAAVANSARTPLRQAAHWHAHLSDLWGTIGLALVFAMAGCCILTDRDRNPGPNAVLGILATVYVLRVLLIV